MPEPEIEPTLFPNAASWETWLQQHHETSSGIWLRVAKKASPLESVSCPEALDVALCYGWIDAQRKSLDADCFLQRYTPRGKRSLWSQINRAKALELTANGRMQPAGLREIERAKADGRWDAAYEPASAATVPSDLQAELDRNPAARAFFETLRGTNRYAILFRIQTAKKPETRTRRIQQFIAMLEKGETIYP